MTTRATCWIGVCVAALLTGCPKSSDGDSTGTGHSTGGTGASGTGGAVGTGGSSGHAGSGGQAGNGGNGGKPAGGTGGKPAGGSDAGEPAGNSGGNSGGVCNLACVRGKHCELKPTAMCVDDASDAGAGGLHWVAGCGSPVCRNDGMFDDPNIPNCTTQKEGQSCTTDGERCDGVLSCGATLLCAAQAPMTCPISRARYKQDIRYLGAAERAQFHDQLTQMPLASYRYKTAPDVPQLGFMIDDIEPSVAVSGDHVNLYGYLSMAVAAIQVQDEQIKALEQQVEELRTRLDGATTEDMCTQGPR